MIRPSVIAFDLFGTVFQADTVPHEEKVSYVKQVRSEGPWQPLRLPASWRRLIPFSDSKIGIQILRDNAIVCVTLTNLPVDYVVDMSQRAGISWDFIVPLQFGKVYKPNPLCWDMLREAFPYITDPQRFLMVTGNKNAGDLEAAKAAGMQAQLIRDPNGCNRIIDLAKMLGST